MRDLEELVNAELDILEAELLEDCEDQEELERLEKLLELYMRRGAELAERLKHLAREL